MCGCNKATASPVATKWQLTKPDGVTVTFSTETEARAARTMAGGGTITKI